MDEKYTTSSAVMCETPPFWSGPFRKSKITQYSPRSKFILIILIYTDYYSVSDKTYVTVTAKLLIHIIRRKKASKKVGRLGLASIDSGLGEFRAPFLH